MDLLYIFIHSFIFFSCTLEGKPLALIHDDDDDLTIVYRHFFFYRLSIQSCRFLFSLITMNLKMKRKIFFVLLVFQIRQSLSIFQPIGHIQSVTLCVWMLINIWQKKENSKLSKKQWILVFVFVCEQWIWSKFRNIFRKNFFLFLAGKMIYRHKTTIKLTIC